MMFKRDRSEVMPGQMEKLVEAAVDTLLSDTGAGSDLPNMDAHDTLEDFEREPFIEVDGRIDLPQFIREIVAKWEEVRLP